MLIIKWLSCRIFNPVDVMMGAFVLAIQHGGADIPGFYSSRGLLSSRNQDRAAHRSVR